MNIAQIQVSYQSKTIGQEKVNNAELAYNLFLKYWDMQVFDLKEEFKVLLLNRSNYPLGIYTLSMGGNHGTVVDIRILMGVLLKSVTTGIILCHNHPSGGLNPSTADNKITEQINSACKMFNIVLLDHVIATRNGFYSYAEDGQLF